MDNQPQVTNEITTEKIDDETSYLVTTRTEKRKMKNEDIIVVLQRQRKALDDRAAKMAQDKLDRQAALDKTIAGLQ